MLVESPSPRLAVRCVIRCAASTFVASAAAQQVRREPLTRRVSIINAEGTAPTFEGNSRGPAADGAGLQDFLAGRCIPDPHERVAAGRG
jgi:hypothetical protein